MSRRTLIYLGILLALAALTVVQNLAPDGPTPIAFKIGAISKDAVQKITLTASGETVVLERAGEGFNITAPLSWPADDGSVQTVLRAFEEEIRMDFLVSEDPADQAAYELTEDQALKLEIYTGGELPEVALYLGKNGPMGTNFIRPVGSAEIYRAKVGTVSRFEKPAAEWRDKRVIRVEQDQIVGLKVAPAEGETVEVRKVGDSWEAVQPSGLALDQSQVTGMSRAFANLRATEIVDGEPAGANLSAPSLTVTATLKEGAPVSLMVGGEKEEGSVWVGRSSDAQRFVVRDASLGSLRKGAEDLRDKALMTFKPEQVVRITATRGEEKVVIEAGEGQSDWRLIEGRPSEASAQTMQGILTSLGSLRAVSFEEGTSPEGAGLAEGATQVAVELEAGEVVSLTLGGDAGDGKRYARVGDGPIVTVRQYVAQNVAKLLPPS